MRALDIAVRLAVALILTILTLPESSWAADRGDIQAHRDAGFTNLSTGERIANAGADPGDWLTTGRTYGEARFSPLTQINAKNVNKLGLVWYYVLDTRRGQESTPLAVGGVLYTTSAWSKVQALDAVTGKLLWQFDPKVPGRAAVKACCDVVNRGAAYWNGRIYVATIDGRLIAIDAASGRQAWSVQTTDPDKSYTITGAPRIVKGLVIIGNGGAEQGVRGYVSAYHADTGRLAWRFYTVPGRPGVRDGAASDQILDTLARKTWSGDWWSKGGGGGGTVWDSMAYDPELDLLYIGTDNGSYWDESYRSPGGGDNLFLATILALRPESGKYVWHFQEVPGEEWDYGATQNMILADLDINGRTSKVLMQAPKDGYFYVLDRATGKLISAKAYVPINWAKSIDPSTGRPQVVPEARYESSAKLWIAEPGSYGGHDWQPMAFNTMTGLVYIPAMEYPGAYGHTPDFKPLAVGENLSIDVNRVAAWYTSHANSPRKGYLLAWDPVHQREVWRAPSPGVWNGGVLTTAGGLVVEGDSGGFVNVYAATTGQRLWAYDAHSAIVAPPITFEVRGKQYITLVVGPAAAIAGAISNKSSSPGCKGRPPVQVISTNGRVLTFALGGDASLPRPSTVTMDAPRAPAQTGTRASIKLGESLFDRTCITCHGLSAVGNGIVPDLRYSAPLYDKNTWEVIVLGGALTADGMVSFRRNYTPAQVEAIRDYVISRARLAQSPGNCSKGE